MIKYCLSMDAWDNYVFYLQQIISRFSARKILEIGAGANPALPLDYVSAAGIDYTILDISAEELSKAPQGYRKMQADICDGQVDITQRYDLVISKMMAEHVPDGRAFHTNVHRLLNDGGIAFHFFPTLYSFPFVVNWLLPEKFTDVILHIMNPRDPYRTGKFRSHYHWCRGPTNNQMEKLVRIGYQIEEYIGLFGHTYYQRIKPVDEFHKKVSRFLVDHPVPSLTSYAFLVLSKRTA